MRGSTPDNWATRLEASAAAHAVAPESLIGFRDELGHRREADTPFLAHHLGRDPGRPPSGSAPQAALWWAVHDAHAPIDGLIDPNRDAPLLAELTGTAIEFASEADLCALHAIWALARLRRCPDLRARALDAARWHIEHTGPDNASAHPWAIHVFVTLGTDEAHLYAQTLMHNAITMLGKPDRRSAFVMLDAARELRTNEVD